MKELKALNMLLRLIGSSPVNDIDTLHPDAANAKTTLDRNRLKAQRRGWWFNIDYNVTFSPDEDNFIKIPSEITSLVATSQMYIQRGNKLYNKSDNTFLFTEDIIGCRTIRALDWDDMPDVVQTYCAYLAGAEFVRDELEDPVKEKSLKIDAGIELMAIKKQDLEEGRYNMFHSQRAIQARAGVLPYHRNNRRFFGTPDV